MEGWIKLHRSIVDNWIWENNKYFKWWITILIYVNHSNSNVFIGDKMVICKPGESFRSIESWSLLFGCSKKTVIKFFNALKNDDKITCKIMGNGNRRKHLLSVTNWAKYQETETRLCPERKPDFTLNGNPTLPPNKNNKEYKEDIKENIPKGISKKDELSLSDRIDYEALVNYFNTTFKGKLRSVTKITDKRKTAIKNRIKDCGKESIQEAFDMVLNSKFLLESNKEGRKFCDFDWIFNPANFIKILEGKYVSDDYKEFRKWMKKNAPFCNNPKNFTSSIITEDELHKLKEEGYKGDQIAYEISELEKSENRGTYTNLYLIIKERLNQDSNGR